MGKNKTIACIVVTYNRIELLKKCIDSLREQSLQDFDIFVINNGSTDGTKEWLETQDDLLVTNQNNEGGAGGFYTGMKTAYDKGYEWVWLMDDDGVADKHQLKNLVRGAKRSNSSFVNALVCDIMDNGKLSFGINVGNEAILTVESAQTYLEIQGSINPFNGTLIHRDVISSIGLIKKEMFIWGDETEYTLRAKQNGFKYYTITDAIHYHPRIKGNKVNIVPFLNKYKITIKPQDKIHIYFRNLGYIYQTYSMKSITNILLYTSIYYICRLRLSSLINMLRYFTKGRRGDFSL